MASHVYAKDLSFQDKQVDDEVELMTRLYHYVSGNPAAVRCIVVSTSRINCLAQEALTENWRGLLWIDSDQHFEDLQIVERAVTAAENFSEGIDDLSTLYDQLVAYIREDTGDKKDGLLIPEKKVVMKADTIIEPLPEYVIDGLM
ncbi:MAG: hypothetical protein EBW14_18560, partial [Oxalobacteraceae bacterium]|nr:hypothetical protein [Oxalobacteraceae bacterium]